MISTNYLHFVNRNDNCTDHACQLSLYINVESDEFVINVNNGRPSVSLGGQSLQMPGVHNGMVFETVGEWIFIEAQGLGFKLHWNSQDYLVITLSPVLWGKTVGLCGSLSGNPYDDFKDLDEENVHSMSDFVRYWSIGDHECNGRGPSQSLDTNPCQNKGSRADSEATEFCKKMIYNLGLVECYDKLNPLPYYESCKWSYCEEHPNEGFAKEFGCQAAESYVRACRNQGVIPRQWRQPDFCRKSFPVYLK